MKENLKNFETKCLKSIGDILIPGDNISISTISMIQRENLLNLMHAHTTYNIYIFSTRKVTRNNII